MSVGSEDGRVHILRCKSLNDISIMKRMIEPCVYQSQLKLIFYLEKDNSTFNMK